MPPGRCPDLALHLRDRGRAAVARFFEVAASDISEETWDALTESLGLHVEMGKVRAMSHCWKFRGWWSRPRALPAGIRLGTGVSSALKICQLVQHV